jgi:two-component system response regulator DegU
MIKPRIIVADDSQPFLDKLSSLLAGEFDIVATAMDGKKALDLILRHEPDLAVIDLNMPALSGIEVAKRLPGLPVVICSMETDPEIAEAARGTGAQYVFKARIHTDLIATAKAAVQGNPVVAVR